MTARFIRTTGERYDGDWFSGPSCDCGCDYHGHECVHVDADGYSTDMPATDIARIMGWERAEDRALEFRP